MDYFDGGFGMDFAQRDYFAGVIQMDYSAIDFGRETLEFVGKGFEMDSWGVSLEEEEVEKLILVGSVFWKICLEEHGVLELVAHLVHF